MEQMVVQKGGEEVMARGHRMRVSGEMEIDILHGNHLSPAPAGASPFDPEHRTKRRLPERDNRSMTQSRQPHGKTDRCRGLSLTKRCRVDSCHQHVATQSPVLEAVQDPERYLCLICSIQDEFLGSDTELTSYVDDGLRLAGRDNCDVSQDVHSKRMERTGAQYSTELRSGLDWVRAVGAEREGAAITAERAGNSINPHEP